jgi:hypothetical protein
MMVVVSVKIVCITQKASTVINASQNSIVLMENYGMKLTFVNRVIAIISIALEIVKKKPEDANVVLNFKSRIATHVPRDISAIQTADHVSVSLMAPKDITVSQLMENAHVNQTLLAIFVGNVHLAISTSLSANVSLFKILKI